jgi:putative PIN family toxin of toxin-antitoxin system
VGAFKMRRVVLDTNVIVSALLFGGTPGPLISLWKEKIIQPLITKEIVLEYLRVLAYPDFQLTENEIHFILYHEMLPFFKEIKIESQPVIIEKNPSDDKFLHCAKAGKASAIISGDKHLLNLKSFGSIRIMSPAQFIEWQTLSVS